MGIARVAVLLPTFGSVMAPSITLLVTVETRVPLADPSTVATMVYVTLPPVAPRVGRSPWCR
jgi:hypothetical protein